MFQHAIINLVLRPRPAFRRFSTVLHEASNYIIQTLFTHTTKPSSAGNQGFGGTQIHVSALFESWALYPAFCKYNKLAPLQLILRSVLWLIVTCYRGTCWFFCSRSISTGGAASSVVQSGTDLGLQRGRSHNPLPASEISWILNGLLETLYVEVQLSVLSRVCLLMDTCTCTLGWEVPIAEIVSQYPRPLCMIWTNSASSMSKFIVSSQVTLQTWEGLPQ